MGLTDPATLPVWHSGHETPPFVEFASAVADGQIIPIPIVVSEAVAVQIYGLFCEPLLRGSEGSTRAISDVYNCLAALALGGRTERPPPAAAVSRL